MGSTVKLALALLLFIPLAAAAQVAPAWEAARAAILKDYAKQQPGDKVLEVTGPERREAIIIAIRYYGSALVQRAADIDWNEFGGIARLGITAGASAPEVLVEEIIDAFAQRYHVSVETVSAAEEGVFFPLPRPLRENQAAE